MGSRPHSDSTGVIIPSWLSTGRNQASPFTWPFVWLHPPSIDLIAIPVGASRPNARGIEHNGRTGQERRGEKRRGEERR